MFLPLIDQPASNVDTIYTTLHCATNIAKSHGQKTCLITFDQPLYSKDREIVAASDANSELCKIVAKLGGFHMFMSFLGFIGYIMDGSELKEALGKIYATNSVDKMLNDHVYSRSIGGRTLLRLAILIIMFEDMKIEDCVLNELTEQINCRNVSYEGVEGILENLPNLDQLAQVFQEENCNVQTLHENGIRVLLTVYNAPKSENSIDNLRYTQFIRSTKLNKPVQLSNLPPTSVAAHQHINRVYYQVQSWLENDLKPQEWGWILRNEFLEPITTVLSPSPDELLNTIYCNCKNGCGSRCECKKSGLQCSSACQCNGQACFNASRYESDLDEDCTFYPKILQDLETNIFDDLNNEKELEIFE
ncbi:uncharacterized protein TNIN_370461 [Trichonephila inaurata madagascariensis]|uniref:Tesmin/TSO1-like CXC domain-containing protein n=1 Tax=Trichonephila inaurata madagascariensis TaxID=2747483 RepID=A0A8X6YQ29_9ARAC|nr:uncharacterized protein TNIN_370461 [Trichonephila inaurata madagascariensis]